MTAQSESEDILSEAEFWKLVQNPATRIKDPVQLVALADKALASFKNGSLVEVVATIVLAYRAVGPEAIIADRREDLIADLGALQRSLPWNEGFQKCRWSLSAKLAAAALQIDMGRFEDAAKTLRLPDAQVEEAFRHGQLMTNVVKCALLSIMVQSEIGVDVGAKALAEKVISLSRIITVNYRFDNEFAYEEASYVFSMLRQIYNFLKLEALPVGAPGLFSAGVDWRVIGGPFKHMFRVRK